MSPAATRTWLRFQARSEMDAAKHAETTELRAEHRAMARDFARAARRLEVLDGGRWTAAPAGPYAGNETQLTVVP